MAIQLMSNVKIITSGNTPTTANLLPGQAAFGKLTSDGKYHLFGNTGEGDDGVGKVVDIVLDTYSALSAPDIQTVLGTGNKTSTNLVFVSGAEGTIDTILLEASTGNITSEGNITSKAAISASTVGATAANFLELTVDTIKMSEAGGITDNNYAVLTANPNRTVSDTDATTMRNFLKVYSKSEIDGMVTGAYHTKGSVAANALPTEGNKIGDVYNISANTTGVVDIHGNPMKVGDNVVWVQTSTEGEGTFGWDTLSGVTDLSAYYTSAQVDALLKTINDSIAAINTDITDNIKPDITSLKTKVQTLENAGYLDETAVKNYLTTNNYVKDADYVHTDTNYTAADKAKVDKITTTGDGTKVLTDDGTYKQLELSVVAI